MTYVRVLTGAAHVSHVDRRAQQVHPVVRLFRLSRISQYGLCVCACVCVCALRGAYRLSSQLNCGGHGGADRECEGVVVFLHDTTTQAEAALRLRGIKLGIMRAANMYINAHTDRHTRTDTQNTDTDTHIDNTRERSVPKRGPHRRTKTGYRPLLGSIAACLL